MNKWEILPQEEEQDYRNCTDRFWVLKCSAFFYELQIQTISCTASRACLLSSPVCGGRKTRGGKRSINYPTLELMNIYLLMLHVGRG